MDSIKEGNINLNSDEVVAEDLLSGEAEVEDTTAAEETEESEGNEELLHEEVEEIKPPPPLGEYDAIDDSARMYLQEIGRVPLLNVQEEKFLCRKIELGRSLEKIEDNHFRKHKKFPSPVDIVIHVISQLSKAAPVVQIIEEHIGIKPSDDVVTTIKAYWYQALRRCGNDNQES